MSGSRHFLLLQGVCSPFFAQLADRLTARGHRVSKIHFNTGDWAAWGGRPALHYRGNVADLPDFIGDLYQRLGITDQILFGDRRPVHRPAITLGTLRDVRSHVFEEGYFRPYWVTLERQGVNAHSLLPRDPAWFREVGASLPDYGDGVAFVSPFRKRVLHDVAYHAAGFWNPMLYPGYRTHAPVNAAIEYAGYARRLPMLRFHKPRDNALTEQLVQSATPYFLLPLQLGSDAQIRDHSRFTDMADVMTFVFASFALHAPEAARLVVKNHPLEMGLVNYPRIVARLANRFGLTGRVDYMETGNLERLLQHAQGTVTVNSTVGALSLGFGCPTIALSNPIYNLNGLTYQGGLDAFWRAQAIPDAELFRCFRNTVIHTTQVNGGFYCHNGIMLTIDQCLPMLEADQSPLEKLLSSRVPS